MREFNPFFKKFSKKQKRVAVVYPNRYAGGITNLGLQRIYFEINSDEDHIAERFYTDVFEGLRSVESGSYLDSFSVALFSLQYEEDIFNAFRILKKTQFKGRTVAGGPCVIQNPFPFVHLFDNLFIGDAENAVIDILENRSVEGLFPGSLKRRVVDLDSEMKKQIVSENAYGRSILIEIGRGCPRGCRFCIVRQIYSPTRWRSADEIISIAEENRKAADKIAIISPSPTDHPDFREIVHELKSMGFEVSPSSIRADKFDEEMAELLGDVRTLTLAPEAGSERLREALNKGIDEEDILNAVEMARNAERVKLYFMFGLPGESYEDLDQIIRLVERVRDAGKKVSVSVNPLVPKHHTPFQWMPYGGDWTKDVLGNIKEMRRKRKYLISKLGKIAETDVESVERFAIQTAISRGDERVGDYIERKLTLARIIKSDLIEFLESQPPDREFPWDAVDMGYKKSRLKKEFEMTLKRLEIET